jgi:hypothetical protein
MFPHPTTTTLKRALIDALLGFRANARRPDSNAGAPPAGRGQRDFRSPLQASLQGAQV